MDYLTPDYYKFSCDDVRENKPLKISIRYNTKPFTAENGAIVSPRNHCAIIVQPLCIQQLDSGFSHPTVWEEICVMAVVGKT